MTHRYLVLFILVNLTLLSVVPGQTGAQVKSDKVRQAALKLASNDLADVKLLSGDKRKGRISAVTKDSFTLSDEKTGAAQTVAFSEVDKISKHKKGLGTGAWIAIAAGAAGAIIATVMLRSLYCNEHAC